MDEMQRELLGRGILTNYQFDRLARGERTGFFYGDYKVLYLVGTGSFARVYRAVHKDSDKVVALKVLRKRFSETPLQTEQFLREGRMGAKLRHPNIVPIFEVYSAKRTHFLVMEFVEGQNLRDFVRVRKKLSIPDAVSIATDITAGLAYAADRGITHRDMKLSNALIASSGRAQLVDFGLAAATAGGDNDEEISDNPRTVDYAGLEKATGVEKDDSRSDIFFNGCMLYQMLCGEVPLGDRTQRMNQSRFGDITPIQVVDPSLPGRLVMIVNKAMELQPEKRYQTQNEMLVDLKKVMLRIKEGKLLRDDPTADDTPDEDPKTVMIVESSPRMQDVFRSRLKKQGYRALVMRSPSLAMQRLNDGSGVADCVVFSCIGLGQEGLNAFNHFATHTATSSVPCILLLDRVQKDWKPHAKLADHRTVLVMPIKMRQFKAAIDELLD
jgi:serine/threonine-protein kinase